MAIEIRTPQISWTSQQITIGGITLNFELRWMTREGVWVADIFDVNSNSILTGVKLTENTSINMRYYVPDLPEGDFWVLRVESQADTITRNNLGSSFKLVFLTYEESVSAGLR
jgi:hypothetical protein